MIIASKKIEVEIIVREPEERQNVSSPIIKKKLNDYSWEEIVNIAKSGKAEEYFEIGNEKIITLANGEELTLAICGFNHDIDANNQKLPITFTTKNLLSGRFEMNKTDTNKGGWEKCRMRNITLKDIFELLPEDLKKYIKETNKGKVFDKLFLFNEVEIFGETIYSEDDFGNQYEYYKDKQHRNKYRNDENYSSWYWLRSPYSSNSTYFCYVTSYGNANYFTASYAYGVAFGFCI